MDKSLLPYIIAGLTTVIASGIGAWALIQSKRPSLADAQDAVNDGFEKFVTASNNRVDELEERIERDKKDCDEKLSSLKGAIRELFQWAYSLENLLRKSGVDIPPRPRLTFQALSEISERTWDAPQDPIDYPL